MKSRLRTFAVCLCAIVVGSCKDDVDYVHVFVQGSDPILTASPLTLDVAMYGDGKARTFSYTAPLKQASAGSNSPPTTDFTIELGSGAGSAVDLRVATTPADAVPWGGDVLVKTPGSGRSLFVPLTRGERDIVAVTQLDSVDLADGDMQTSALFGNGLVLAWSSRGQLYWYSTQEPDRPQGRANLVAEVTQPEREPVTSPSRLRIASRQAGSADLFALTWLSGSSPKILTRSRTTGYEPRSLRLPCPQPPQCPAAPRADDVHVAVSRRDSPTAPPVVTALLDGSKVTVLTLEEDGSTRRAFSDPALERVAAIAGILPTPNNTLTLALRGNGSRLVQMNADSGAIIAQTDLSGEVRAVTASDDGNRLIVATATRAEVQTLQIETYPALLCASGDASCKPTTTRLAEFPFIASETVSRVSLSSWAAAWPERRSDDSNVVDIRYVALDANGLPTGDEHVANVAEKGDHFAPTIVSASPTRVYVTFLERASATDHSGRLFLRRLSP